MIPVLFVVTILVFSIIRFIPGEPARLILGEKATEEAVAALTEKLGLNEPLLTPVSYTHLTLPTKRIV